jgi:hypothetical protein
MKTLAIVVEDACAQENLQLKVHAKKKNESMQKNIYHTK